MEKFKVLRLKFEQRRSMRSQAAKAQSLAQETDKVKSPVTSPVDGSKEFAKEISGGNLEGRGNSRALANDQAIESVQTSDKTSTGGQKDNVIDTSKEKVKAVSMPVKRSSTADSDKPQPEMKFKVNKDKPASMPVKKKPTDSSAQAPARVNFKINKDKPASMPAKRHDTTEEQSKVELKFKANKDKVVAMPVKRRDTQEKGKDVTSKRLSGTDSDLSGTEDKGTSVKPVPTKCVSMPIKPKKEPEKDVVPGVKIKPSGHVSMPIKRKDTKEKESIQTVAKTQAKETAKDTKTEQKAPYVVSKEANKVANKNIKSNEPATKMSGKQDAKDNKKGKVQFLSVNEVGNDSNKARKQDELKPALRKNVGEKKLDTLAVEEYHDVTRERKSSLSEDKLQEIQEAFVVFDQNRDGEITKEELGAVLYALGQRPTVTEVQALIRSVDLDKSGTIDFDEFVKIFSSKLTVDPEQELHEVFDIFDNNLDGFISDDELFSVLQKLGEQTSLAECKKMIAEADLNGDGRVDYREFKAILNSR